jgi:hypothetical protein
MSGDFTLCRGGECPLQNACRRKLQPIYGRQDFFGIPPYSTERSSCEYFTDVRPTIEEIRTEAYFRWKNAGCPEGRALSFWYEAEEFLRKKKIGEI